MKLYDYLYRGLIRRIMKMVRTRFYPPEALFDLSNTILKNINPQHKIQGMIKKKTSLLSFLYKKPKEIKK